MVQEDGYSVRYRGLDYGRIIRFLQIHRPLRGHTRTKKSFRVDERLKWKKKQRCRCQKIKLSSSSLRNTPKSRWSARKTLSHTPRGSTISSRPSTTLGETNSCISARRPRASLNNAL